MRTLLALIFSLVSVNALSEKLYTDDGYRIPTEFPVFQFPRDHGSHPEFRIEWWYITGHLHADNKDRYGFQATFFRYAIKPDADAGSKTFGSEHIFMAHMAFSDINQKGFSDNFTIFRNIASAFPISNPAEFAG